MLSGSVLAGGKLLITQSEVIAHLSPYASMEERRGKKKTFFFSFRMRHLLCKTVYSEISKLVCVCVWFIFLSMRGKRLIRVGDHKTIAEKRRLRIIVPFLFLFIANRSLQPLGWSTILFFSFYCKN